MIEKIVVCEEIKTRDVITVRIKIKNGNWYQYFLDAGIGFFESWNELDEIDDEKYADLDKTYEFKLYQKKISRIYCMKDFNNSKIIIEFGKEEKLILKCKNLKLFDSECELIKI